MEPALFTKWVSYECTSTHKEGNTNTAHNGFIEVEYYGVDPPAGFTSELLLSTIPYPFHKLDRFY